MLSMKMTFYLQNCIFVIYLLNRIINFVLKENNKVHNKNNFRNNCLQQS